MSSCETRGICNLLRIIVSFFIMIEVNNVQKPGAIKYDNNELNNWFNSIS